MSDAPRTYGWIGVVLQLAFAASYLAACATTVAMVRVDVPCPSYLDSEGPRLLWSQVSAAGSGVAMFVLLGGSAWRRQGKVAVGLVGLLVLELVVGGLATLAVIDHALLHCAFEDAPLLIGSPR